MKGILSILLVFISCLTNAQNVLVKHNYLTIVYDTLHHCPIYSRYILKADSIDKIKTYRTQFHYDYLISYMNQPNMKEYIGSGYDKGHLAPDRDFTYSLPAEQEAMFITNVAPQNPNLNRGVWKQIEEYVRKLSYRFDSLEIITGVIYKGNMMGNIPLPEYFYKIVNTYTYKLYFLCKNEPCIKCDIDDQLVDERTFIKIVWK